MMQQQMGAPLNQDFTTTIQIGSGQMPMAQFPQPHHHHHHAQHHAQHQHHLQQHHQQPNLPLSTADTATQPVQHRQPAPVQGDSMTAPNGTSLVQPPASGTNQLDPLAGVRQSHGLEPMPRPSSAPGHPPIRPQAQQRLPMPGFTPHPPRSGQMFGAFGSIPLPFPQQTHLPFPFGVQAQHQPQPQTQPTVWLASSPNGPQALLFAPGHGYYTTLPTSQPDTIVTDPATTTSAIPNQSTPAVTTTSGPRPTPTTQPPPPNHNPPPPQPGAVPQPNAQAQLARLPRPHVPLARPAEANNEDLFALIVQRGWLFLRLYMFMFVLSEPGTWRRYFLLFIAVLVCILPQRNPLNTAFGHVRRHVDRLIGPPHPQRQEGEERGGVRNDAGGARGRIGNNARNQPRGNGQAHEQAAQASIPAPAAAPGPSNTTPRPARGAVNTTPEEAAQRLVREHEQRNPNMLRDVFYRVEQAAALFLASLIPGVGERHVAAREEVRRQERIREAEDVIKEWESLRDEARALEKEAKTGIMTQEAHNRFKEIETIMREDPEMKKKLDEWDAKQDEENTKALEEVRIKQEGERTSADATGADEDEDGQRKGKGKEVVRDTLDAPREESSGSGSSSGVQPHGETEEGVVRARFT